VLDISYNNLSPDDLLTLGLLAHLKVLHLTGNNFSSLPPDLAVPYLSREKQVRLQRFPCLEILLLDDNKLMDMEVFAALAGLPKLRHLDLSKNKIFCVPQLKVVQGRVVTQDGKERKRCRRPRSSRKSAKCLKSRSLGVELGASVTDVEIPTESQTVTHRKDETAGEDEAVEPDDSRQCNTELRPETFSTGDLSARIRNFVSDNEEPVEKPAEARLPPFSELRYLNLSHNKIYEESGLLAVAAWPVLEEVEIFDNPLTTESTGDPPLLKVFLQERLGIKLNRIKPQGNLNSAKRAKTEIRPKHIKITEIVPKIPKMSAEEKMMLQLPPSTTHQPVEFNSSSDLRATSAASSKKPVLPPIGTTDCDAAVEAELETERTQEGEENLVFTEDGRGGAGLPEQEGFDPFFMTQVDDTAHDRPTNMPSSSLHMQDNHMQDNHMQDNHMEDNHMEDNHMQDNLMENNQSEKIIYDGHIQKKPASAVSDKYKGYELLLDIEDLEHEPTLPPAKDIQGNVRALRHALNHLLVFRDPAVELNKVHKMVQEYRRVPVPPARPHLTYQQKVDQVLSNLKTRSTLEEENLATVLEDKGRLHQKFSEADQLLGRVQRRYNTIRNQLVSDAKQAGSIAAEVLELLAPPGAK
ncbi:unnamed protein product, partial [Candidula unifasciata]